VGKRVAELKRQLIKYCRDKAKSKYDKGTECFICGSIESLEFHHYNGMTELLEKWLKQQGISNISTAEDIMDIREQFISENLKEIYDETVTLCKTHHQRLHGIYGKRPQLHTAKKQERWVIKRRDKEYELV
jgi:hypothetical protein